MKLILLLTAAAVVLVAGDVTGKWRGKLLEKRADGTENSGPAFLVLKQEGTTVTGTVGPDENERHEVRAGKEENGTVTLEVPSGPLLMKFTLKLDGEHLKGDVVRERNGQTQTGKLSVKREAAKP